MVTEQDVEPDAEPLAELLPSAVPSEVVVELELELDDDSHEDELLLPPDELGTLVGLFVGLVAFGFSADFGEEVSAGRGARVAEVAVCLPFDWPATVGSPPTSEGAGASAVFLSARVFAATAGVGVGDGVASTRPCFSAHPGRSA